jgi:hypothetical protein
MGHGCTNYGGFGDWVGRWLDRIVGWNRIGIDDAKMRKSGRKILSTGGNGPTQAKTGLEWATRPVRLAWSRDRRPSGDGWPTQARFWLEWGCTRVTDLGQLTN